MKTKNLGFSLVELLIAMGITAIISVVVAQGLFSTSRGSVKVEVRNTVKQGGDFTLGVMEKLIREARSIDCAHTTTYPNQLKLISKDYQETTFACAYNNEVTRIASISASGAINHLSPTNVTLGGTSCSDGAMSLHFTCTTVAGLPNQVGIQFSLSQKGTPANQFEAASVSFSSSVTARN